MGDVLTFLSRNAGMLQAMLLVLLYVDRWVHRQTSTDEGLDARMRIVEKAVDRINEQASERATKINAAILALQLDQREVMTLLERRHKDRA